LEENRMKISIADFELENMVRVGDTLRTRKGFVSVKTPTAGTKFVAAWTQESPFTSEPWQYLVEQSTTTRLCTLRVFTEEYGEMFSLDLGVLQKNPVITQGSVNNQMMVNSPAFSTGLYGLVGGGLITAVKTASEQPDTTALDIPAGHVCAFGDRFPIAQGNIEFFNDPGIDPRTYVAENAVPLPGNIYDHMQGPDGGLYMFTSAGVFTMPQDALGQGQQVTGFIGRVPGVETTRSRNACATKGAVVVLQKDEVVLLPSKERIDLSRSSARRYFSSVTDVDDLRRAGELHATPDGFLVAFRGARGFFLEANVQNKTLSWVSDVSVALNVVGTLRSRDGELLYVTEDAVLHAFTKGTLDPYTSSEIRGVARGVVEMPVDQRPIVRRVTVSADNAGAAQYVTVDGTNSGKTTPTKSGDAIIGTSTWSNSSPWVGRSTRTVRHSFAKRSSDPHLEVVISGGDHRVEAEVDVEFTGQGRARRDKS
jgi:hypothetical protein